MPEVPVSERRTATAARRELPPIYTSLNHNACASDNQYDSIAMNHLQRQTSDDYLKLDHYDYISSPEDVGDDFRIV